MNDFFYEENFIFESMLSIIDNRYMNTILEYEESYSKNHYLTESEKKSLVFKTREFFNRLINAITTFMKNIKNKIDNFVRSNKIDIELMKKKSYFKKKKKKGVTSVTSIDIVKYKETYLDEIKKLWKYVSRIKEMKYKSIDQIENDLNKFKKIMEEYENKLDTIYDKKIEIPIDKAINIVNDEIHGKSTNFQTIQRCETELREMQIYIDSMENRFNSIGDEIIPKKVNLLVRICTDISKFVKKHVSRIIGTIVFLFAF